jgi:hypothetical protein
VAVQGRCPLTDQPAPQGVPNRPAIAIKVDNYTAARPQTGLDSADVVYEELVEGGITRFVAVYQCSLPPLVGPVRSARGVDLDILGQLNHPLFVHAGGIDPVISLLRTGPLTDVNVFDHMTLAIFDKHRRAPYNLFVSPEQALKQLNPGPGLPPFLFPFGPAAPPGGEPATAVHAPMSETSDVYWRWDAGTGKWVRSYQASGAPALDSEGNPLAFTNVIIQVVQVTYGPWVEDINGALEVRSHLEGSGPVYVLTRGQVIQGTWRRPSLTSQTSYLTPSGQPITLAPGNTWVELMPSSQRVTVSSTSSTSVSPGRP